MQLIAHLMCTKSIPLIVFSISSTEPIEGGVTCSGGKSLVSFPLE